MTAGGSANASKVESLALEDALSILILTHPFRLTLGLGAKVCRMASERSFSQLYGDEAKSGGSTHHRRFVSRL
jgi:hypothetical protein